MEAIQTIINVISDEIVRFAEHFGVAWTSALLVSFGIGVIGLALLAVFALSSGLVDDTTEDK